MKIEILSLFPSYFRGPFDVSMLMRAREKGLIEIRHTDIRDFAVRKNGRVDDRPFGGGPGMVLSPQPVAHAIRSVRRPGSHVVYLSPQGTLLNAAKCCELSQKEHLILLCGHYEGIDERVLKEVDEEISIGDYVLTCGNAAAIVLVDAVVRFIPGVIGHPEAVHEDSFQDGGLFDAPHWTRPEEWEGEKVPSVLLGGNHDKIRKERKKRAFEKTNRVRPDLVAEFLKKETNQ
jgi:tRNA (guanine37-N1)-methyltransferase